MCSQPVAKRPMGAPVPRVFVPLSGLLKSRHEGEQLALGQSTPRPVVWKRLVRIPHTSPSPFLSLFVLLIPRPPSASSSLSVSLSLYYYVFAIYLCLHPPAFYFPSPVPRGRGRFAESSASYRTSLAYTPRPAGASSWRREFGRAAPATRERPDLLSTSPRMTLRRGGMGARRVSPVAIKMRFN